MSAASGRDEPARRSWPLLRSLSGWTIADLGRDVLAGVTLAAIAVPEQMATARLAGFAPQIGFHAFIAGSLAFAVFGASRFLSVGADSTVAPIFAAGLALLAAAGSPQSLAAAAALAMMVGVLVCACGLLRFGWIADLLSVPVTTGFLAGIAIPIAISQLPSLLDLPPPDGGTMIQRLITLLQGLPGLNPFSTAIGLGVLATVLVCERISPRIPGALIALALATLAVMAFGLESRGVTVLGPLPGGLPRPSLPAIELIELRSLVPLAMIVAMVVMMQTAATTRSFPPPGAMPDVDRDFIGAGAGNILSGLLGAFPVNASPPRTAIVAETGGRSQLGSLVAAAIVLVLAMAAGGLLAHVPHAALAGVLLFVAQRIFRLQTFARVWRETRAEFALILVTMIAIVTLPIEVGVAVGIGLSLLHGIWSMTRAQPLRFERIVGTPVWWPPAPGLQTAPVTGVLVVGFQAPLSFLNADVFRRGVRALVDGLAEPPGLIVLEASSIIEIDFTAAQALREVILGCRSGGAVFAMARLESIRAREALARFGLEDVLGPGHLFPSVDAAVTALAGAAAAHAPSPPEAARR